jgi:hypothetical protein
MWQIGLSAGYRYSQLAASGLAVLEQDQNATQSH